MRALACPVSSRPLAPAMKRGSRCARSTSLPCETPSGAPGAHLTGRAWPPRTSLGGLFSLDGILDCRAELVNLQRVNLERRSDLPHRAELRHAPPSLGLNNRSLGHIGALGQRPQAEQAANPQFSQRWHASLLAI